MQDIQEMCKLLINAIPNKYKSDYNIQYMLDDYKSHDFDCDETMLKTIATSIINSSPNTKFSPMAFTVGMRETDSGYYLATIDMVSNSLESKYRTIELEIVKRWNKWHIIHFEDNYYDEKGEKLLIP